ncbi:MAG: putative RND superfamily exporter protein [Arenicella sp.]|jgi:predicted RND superfamily exporter protein
MPQSLEQKIIDNLLNHRYLWALISLLITVALVVGSKNLYLQTDYRVFFNDDDPLMLSHQDMQATYTRSDSLGIILKPAQGDVFTERNLSIIYQLTEEAWQTPYAIRVDSIANFQHTSAAQDDLLVEALLLDPRELNDTKIANIKKVALSERELVNRLVSRDGKTVLINVSLEMPPLSDKTADLEIQAQQRAALDGSYPEMIKFADSLIDSFSQNYPDLEFHLIGVPVINNSFTRLSIEDLSTLTPAMYLLIVVLLALFLRALGSIVAAVILIALASAAALGGAGWLGFTLNPVNVIAPTIILMIAVCDVVHLLSIYVRNLGLQQAPLEAMRESLRLNLQPILLTSLTTAVGFFTLNFSTSPPFRELGTISGIGVLWAMVLTFTLLPALILLLVRKRKASHRRDQVFIDYSHFIIRNKKSVLLITSLLAVALMALIPLNRIDDDPAAYFKPGVPYRDANDFQVANLPAINDINFSISCGEPSCVNSPAYLKTLDDFRVWVEQQPYVEFVSTYADVMKRLNKSMNADQIEFYSVPQEGDLAAQYNLMYEMSLPYGLDLNNQLNLDKSSSKVTVFTSLLTTGELLQTEANARQWFEDNAPQLASQGSSVMLMFANTGENNIRSMMVGALIAVIGVTLTILLSLRSFKYAIISMVPNVFPALMAFGIWGVFVGQINLAVAAVFSICLGILVDDTVHFISKYRRAREQKSFSPEQAIEYAFTNVGSALVVTTVVLVLGFSILNLSQFNLNAMTGQLTALTIGIALVFDFLILPPILLLVDKD